MSLESPATYGEEFFAAELQALKDFAEVEEQAIKPFIPSIFADPELRESIPFDILTKIEGLLQFDSPGLAGFGVQFASGIANETVSMAIKPPLRKTQYAANRSFPNMIVTPEPAIELFKRGKITETDYIYRLRAAGWGGGEQVFLENASYPYPAIGELIRWAKYQAGPEQARDFLDLTYKIPPEVFSLWEFQNEQILTTDQIINLGQRGLMEPLDVTENLKRIGWKGTNIPFINELAFDVPNAMLLYQANLFQDADTETIMKDFKRAKVSLPDAFKYQDAVLTKPSAGDLIQYHLRQENDLADLKGDLTKIGIHSHYHPYYQELAFPIPPVADIISMAVREAFSPGTAERFGQYEDFPPDLEKFAKMKGISEDWSKRYWAAHWRLPSANQGFSMMHRGIIDTGDMNLLLKSLDIMPFWRDRLIELAYRPLSRVDVRRMFSLGVLNEGEVLEAFEELGYNPERAGQMTQYTIQQTLNSLAKFSPRDVITAYAARKINRSEAGSLLGGLGIGSGDIGYVLQTADYKKEWASIDERIRAIKNLYRKQQYDENTARGELLRLALPADEVDDLMDQWFFEKKGDGIKTLSKAEVTKWLKAGMINEDRARQELGLIGYDQERIDLYIKSITWSKES